MSRFPVLAPEMGEEALAKELAQIHTPELDALRIALPTARTSVLIMYANHPEMYADGLLTGDVLSWNRNDTYVIMAAAALAINDEIDRRFPVPAP